MITANYEGNGDTPRLDIYEEMTKQEASTAIQERDSGLGSEIASRDGSWLESGSSDDGVERG